MRKVTVEFTPNAETKRRRNFDKISSIEALQILKTDFDRGMRFGIGICTTKDGFALEDVKNPEMVEVLDVIKAAKNRYTCFVKIKVPDEYMALVRRFDLDLIWDTPTIITEDKITMSVIGDKDGLKRFIEAVKQIGEIRKIKYLSSVFQNYNILSCLTDRQRQIVLEAKRSGYYDYPRRINGEQLAKKIGISKAATIEHLRKAEARIISSIFSGY